MDDLDMESEIQEDISLDEDGKMNWMLDKGLMLGKKALLTGILISSAPLVLPPLVVFSALGLAFSVPSGLAVASYACTEMIMSKLLPMPNPPPTASAYVEEISSDDEDGKMVYGGEIGTRKEEEELIEDTKTGVGLRFEFVEEGKGGRIEGNVLMEQDNLGPEFILNNEAAEPVILLGGDHLVEESGNEEDVEDNIAMKDEQPLGDNAMGVEESTDGKVRKLVIVFEKNDSKVEEIRDEHPVNEMQRIVVKVEKIDESVRGGEAPIQLTAMADITNENELAAETRLVDRIRDENKSMEEAKLQEKGIPGGNQGERGVDNTVESGKLISVGFEAVDGRSMMEEEQGHIICERTALVIGGTNSGDSVAKYVPSDLRKENAISSKTDTREIADESGFDSFNYQNAAAEQYPYRVANVRMGFGGQNGRGFNPESKILSEKGNIVKSNEEQVEKVAESEEKIWERIMAMRAIVGYKAPASRTCAEELKALYVFTGVEPPSSSFKDPSDLMEVSSRLQFLMSIVGVK